MHNSGIRRKSLNGRFSRTSEAQTGDIMPYSSNSDLPTSVRHHLPQHAQDIYREAFNHSFASHEGDSRQEEIAHRTAWAAVKRSYVKVGDEWTSLEAR